MRSRSLISDKTDGHDGIERSQSGEAAGDTFKKLRLAMYDSKPTVGSRRGSTMEIKSARRQVGTT